MRFSLLRTAWLWAHGAVALAFAWQVMTPLLVVQSAALSLVILLLGHTVGLHRGIIHRAYTMPTWLRRVFALLFVLVGMGGPLAWMRVHAQRDHWQNRTDGPRWFLYKHGLLRDFWWNLHCTPAPDAAQRLPHADENDRWLAFLQQTWMLWVLASHGALYLAGGWPLVVLGGAARVFLGCVGHWFVGYACHKAGPQPHVVPGAAESGRNWWILGVLALGEGFHNNHHAFPRSARMGHAWYELDLGWLTIRGLHTLGLVSDVRTPPARAARAPRTSRAAD